MFLLFVPSDKSLFSLLWKKILENRENGVRLFVDADTADCPEFSPFKKEQYIKIRKVPDEQAKNSLILYINRYEPTIDITYATAAYAFLLQGLCRGKNVVVVCGNEILSSPPVNSLKDQKGMNTKAKIIAFLQVNPPSYPRQITEGIFLEPHPEQYNKVRVTVCRLHKEGVLKPDEDSKQKGEDRKYGFKYMLAE